jgi:hypothetical protein
MFGQHFRRALKRLGSSMVEQLTLNQLVRGSSPRGATTFRFFPVTFWYARSTPCRRSSTVEHLFCKQAVAGSNPIAGSIFPPAMREKQSPWKQPEIFHCPMV